MMFCGLLFFFGVLAFVSGLWIGGVNSCDESRLSTDLTMQHSYLHSPGEAAAVCRTVWSTVGSKMAVTRIMGSV